MNLASNSEVLDDKPLTELLMTQSRNLFGTRRLATIEAALNTPLTAHQLGISAVSASYIDSRPLSAKMLEQPLTESLGRSAEPQGGPLTDEAARRLLGHQALAQQRQTQSSSARYLLHSLSAKRHEGSCKDSASSARLGTACPGSA